MYVFFLFTYGGVIFEGFYTSHKNRGDSPPPKKDKKCCDGWGVIVLVTDRSLTMSDATPVHASTESSISPQHALEALMKVAGAMTESVACAFGRIQKLIGSPKQPSGFPEDSGVVE